MANRGCFIVTVTMWNYQGLISGILCSVKVTLRRIEKGEVWLLNWLYMTICRDQDLFKN